MNQQQAKAAAKAFADKWAGRGDEKQDTQSFWNELLRTVYGIENTEEYIKYEKRAKIDNTTKFIDGYIPATKVLIEQKGAKIDLNKAERQSDGQMLTPFQQGRRYILGLAQSEYPKWIVTCNFQEFHIHDMDRPNDAPDVLELSDLPKEYYRLDFLKDITSEHSKREVQVSKDAGDIVAKIYKALLKQYKDPEDEHSLKSLNMLCVRLVFCLYAEDAGIFSKHEIFHDYLAQYTAPQMRQALINLFQVLDQKEEDRDPYLEPSLAEFEYVNGGLFSDTNIEIPLFTDEIRNLILHDAAENFDWSAISPTIFGAIFESTLNPETRRKGGMHYTSLENIHKLIDPLFLDDLKSELSDILELKTPRAKEEHLRDYQNKLANLVFFDPACGSGNFLTETFLCLRRLENRVIRELIDLDKQQEKGQMMMDIVNPIKVNISQFYGIEINDFAVSVAKTAMWIAEAQTASETREIIFRDPNYKVDFLPLKTNANIIEGNALRMDWESVVPKERLSYIMGNPPFVGGMYMSKKQKAEIRDLFTGVKGAGEFDYVTGWYKKATELTLGLNIKSAFVSTNSICQGSQVITFWKHLIKNYNIHIDFAYKTFIWNNEADKQAKVHCVIVGFSGKNAQLKTKKLFSDTNVYKECKEISPYLTDTPVIFIESRSNPICNVPKMRFGSMPRDGGGFVLTPEQKSELIKKEPLSKKWIKPYIGASQFLNNKERYCLWLVNAEPGEIEKCPIVKKRIDFVHDFRANSKAAGTRKFAETPTLFCQIAQPDSDYIIVPKTSSGKRKYIPIGFMDKDTIASDLVFLIPNAGLYEFGVLMSNVHNEWMRLVAGRLKSDYRYSKDIVYNNFPWPSPNADQKERIEKTAQDILTARKLYSNSTLANLYKDNIMPPELLKAHRQNNRAVMLAYGFTHDDKNAASKWYDENETVAALMKMYQKITEEN